MTTKQPEALRLAAALLRERPGKVPTRQYTADTLRRQHALLVQARGDLILLARMANIDHADRPSIVAINAELEPK